MGDRALCSAYLIHHPQSIEWSRVANADTSDLFVNVSSISCGVRGSVWRTATALIYANDRNYRSNRGPALPLRPVPGRKGAIGVEWSAGARNGPCRQRG